MSGKIDVRKINKQVIILLTNYTRCFQEWPLNQGKDKIFPAFKKKVKKLKKKKQPLTFEAFCLLQIEKK